MSCAEGDRGAECGTMPARIRRLALAPPLLAIAFLLSGLPAAAADPISGTATLAVSKGEVTFGGHITLSGAVTSDPVCEGGREVDLQGRGPGESSWTILRVHTTNPDGSFGFYLQPEHSSSYRALLPRHDTADASCTAVRT